MARGDSRSDHDPGHSQRRIVDENPVGALAVFAQTLSMVGRDEHDCARALAIIGEEAQSWLPTRDP